MKKSGCLILAAGSVLGVAILLAAVYFIMNRETSSLTAQTRAALPGQFIALSEGVTHYHLAGPAGGQLVVFVNGFSVGSFGWERTVPALTDGRFPRPDLRPVRPRLLRPALRALHPGAFRAPARRAAERAADRPTGGPGRRLDGRLYHRRFCRPPSRARAPGGAAGPAVHFHGFRFSPGEP